MTSERRKDYNAYMKEYMSHRRSKVKRICPDCGVRELDKNYVYCSECAEVRLYLRVAVRDHNTARSVKI